MAAISEAQRKLIERQEKWLPTRLQEIRAERGLTQDEVGAKLEMTGKRLSDIERGRFDIKWSTICRICFAVGASLDSFFDTCPGFGSKGRRPGAVNRSEHYDYLVSHLQEASLSSDQLKTIGEVIRNRQKAG